MHRGSADRAGSTTIRTKVGVAGKIFAMVLLGALVFGRAALADVDSGIAAFHDGDYETAVKKLQVPAFDGNPAAQYYLGVIHARGIGVARSPTDALKWFLCAEAGSLPTSLKQRSLEWRRRLYSDMSLLEMDYAERSAANGCRAAEAPAVFDQGYHRYQIDDAVPRRSGWVAVLFFPGDVTMQGVLVVLDGIGVRFLMEATLKIIEAIGDVLFGLLALLGWALIARMTYLLFTSLQAWFLDRRTSILSSGRRQESPSRDRVPSDQQ